MAKSLLSLGIVLYVIILVGGTITNENTPASTIAKALTKFIKTGVRSEEIPNAIRNLHEIKNKTFRNDQVCQTCRYIVNGVIHYRRAGVSKDLMLTLMKSLCTQLTTWGQEACDGYSDIEVDAALYIIDNKKDLTADRVCAIYLQSYQCEDPDLKRWSIRIPPLKTETLTTPASTNSVTQTILHLTDVHYDPLYTPGSNAVCNEGLCCSSGKPEKPENAAGYWGDYHVCDTPWHSILDLVNQVTKQHPQIDYIYYTGDIISHRSWATSVQENTESIQALLKLFHSTFKSIPLYPILGNHEAHPSDYYAPLNVTENVSTQWLYVLSANEWSRWLPKETVSTITAGGFYTTLVKPGFRIIALNSNVCYTPNIWLVYDDQDPFGQLQWLADTLAEAEKNGEIVHILSHVPPGGVECWQLWSHQFTRIIKRFSNTIKAQFNGHTHLDEIRIFLDDDKKKTINVAYNGGSFTTFVGYNPNYRLYDVDSVSLQITDYQQWIYNLTDANLSEDVPPKWFKFYSFKEAWGLNSTDPGDLYDLVQRMKEHGDRHLLKQYHKFEVRNSEPEMAKGCDDNCLDKLLCSITSIEFEDAILCQ